MRDPAERRVGTVIAGKWRVDALLGSGSMAAVFAVTHRNGARAALKILHPSLCADEGVCERFLGEGYLTNAVKHLGIVRVLDDGVTDDGCVFLVMDLLDGKTLEAVRQERGGQMDLVEVMDIADKLMDALQAVHNAGIIHRDLKPQNVFVCDDGSVKLLDFGVARILDGSARRKHSMLGFVLGTPSFMSPEQALGAREVIDHRADIWSLGATLFTALTGQTVHLGPHIQAKLLAAATVQARSIALVKQDLPAPIAAAIDTALRFKKEDRWQSVDDFRRTLRDARAQLGLGKPQTVPPPEWLDVPFEINSPEVLAGMRPARVPTGLGGPPPLPAKARKPTASLPEELMPSDLLVEDASLPRVPRALPSAGPPPMVPVHDDGMRSRPPVRTNAAPNVAEIKLAPYISLPDARNDGNDGSFPASASSLKVPDDPRASQVGGRRSGPGVWVAGCVLALTAVSGVAFFAVKRSNLGDLHSPVSAETHMNDETSAPAAASSAPSVSTALVIEPKDFMTDAGVQAQDSPLKASVSVPTQRANAAAPPVARTLRTNLPSAPMAPSSETQQDELSNPSASPELFGTPD